ncbi:MAG: hypothetical protein R8M46_01275 [Ghiorsea sp.]
MAMTIRPTDGLVTRLLQQQTRQTSSPAQDNGPKSNTGDQVSISTQARQEGEKAEVSRQLTNAYGYKQEKLESQLIGLYSQHHKSGSKG